MLDYDLLLGPTHSNIIKKADEMKFNDPV